LSGIKLVNTHGFLIESGIKLVNPLIPQADNTTGLLSIIARNEVSTPQPHSKNSKPDLSAMEDKLAYLHPTHLHKKKTPN